MKHFQNNMTIAYNSPILSLSTKRVPYSEQREVLFTHSRKKKQSWRRFKSILEEEPRQQHFHLLRNSSKAKKKSRKKRLRIRHVLVFLRGIAQPCWCRTFGDARLGVHWDSYSSPPEYKKGSQKQHTHTQEKKTNRIPYNKKQKKSCCVLFPFLCANPSRSVSHFSSLAELVKCFVKTRSICQLTS